MKIVGNTLVWVGVIMLLKSIGIIQVVDARIAWAVVAIVIGSSLKFGCHHGMMCGTMGKCAWKKGEESAK